MSYENTLEIRGLNKTYPEFALKDVNLILPRGSVMGLVGANGAGKTTTMKLILNLIHRDSGEIKIFGMDNIAQEQQIKSRIGVVFDELHFPDNLRMQQVGRVMGSIYRDWDDAYFLELLKRFALSPKKMVKELSRGMKMKLSIAAALAHHPDLLLMDEPTSGLDPIVRNEILELFLDYIQDENRSILLSSHITSDLEKIADSITFIDKGRIVLSDTRDALEDHFGVIKGPTPLVEQLAEEDVEGLEITRYGFMGLVRNKEAMREKYPQFTVERATLEDIILYLARREAK